MPCRWCGSDIRQGAKFCSECGRPTALACPNCSKLVSATDEFCAECGTPLAGAVDPFTTTAGRSVIAEPSRERRFVTAFFIDLVGFTPLTETRDSEEVRQNLASVSSETPLRWATSPLR
jgi:hypothetical protein